ncbi:MAG: HD domain-containing protein, partial [Clostridiales bacterium]|nr:HD domain-containing protein [Clostridiales bacterium]
GKRDIDNKIIRAVGNPDLRFKEDSLRIMRALRFSSVLDFEIEENTSKAIASDKELLKNISCERVFSELMKMLCGKNILNVLDEYRNVIGVIIPELIPSFTCGQNTPWHIYDVYGHMIHAVAAAPENPVIRLAMLLHDIGKPSVKSTDENGRDHFKNHAAAGAEIAANVLKRFKVSNKIYDKVITLIKYHQSFEQVNDIKIKHWLSEIGEDYTRDLIEVRIADLKSHNPENVKAELDKLEEIKAQLERILKNKEPYKISQLAVNGTDLTALGFKGKEIGEKLSEILSLAVDGKLENNRDDIIDFLIKK